MDKRLNSALIKKTLKSKHINQIEFANQLGVSQSAISHYLAGRVNPTDDKLQKISEILDIPIENLIVKNSFLESIGIDVDSYQKNIYKNDNYTNAISRALIEYVNSVANRLLEMKYDENIRKEFYGIICDVFFEFIKKLHDESTK